MFSTYLYIKRHSVTGLKYFGKTIRDPLKYNGSGLHWSPHIKKHGVEHVETLWHKLFTNQEDCTEFALFFSQEMNIVKSDKWANLTPEDGKMGGNTNRSAESYARMGAALTGKKYPLRSWIPTKEQNEANSARQLGRKKQKWTLEQRTALSLKKLGKKRGPYNKQSKEK